MTILTTMGRLIAMEESMEAEPSTLPCPHRFHMIIITRLHLLNLIRLHPLLRRLQVPTPLLNQQQGTPKWGVLFSNYKVPRQVETGYRINSCYRFINPIL